MEPIAKRPVGRPRKTPQAVVPAKPRGDGLRIAAARARSMATATKSYDFPVKPPKLAPGVVPAGVSAPVLAMDANSYAFASETFPGGGFSGFAYLSQLATRAEYRAFAATLSTELTREWIEFTSKQDDDTDTADKIKAIEDEFKRLNVRSVFQRAAECDCYFGRAQIFLEIDGADRGTPLILDPRTVKKGSLARVVSVEAIWTTPAGYNALDPAAADFYKPARWFMLGQEVHASRLMTVVTRPLPDILKPAFNFAGMSLSQLAEPYVDNWLRTRQSVADLIDNFSTTALATSMDQILQGDDDGSDLLNRADLFTATRSNKGLMLLDKEREELVQINTPLSGLHELQAQSQEHMCLSAGTLIETKRGLIPIENVKLSDKIFTRDGYAPVQWVGVTGVTTQFVEIKTRNSTLRVTRNHPIWSVTKNDFVSAESVNPSHTLLKSNAWEFTAGQSIGEVDSGARRKKGILGILKQAACYIGYFGKRTSGRFLTGLMSITGTKIQTITNFQTSFSYQGLNIQQSMLQRGFCNSSATSLSARAFNAVSGILQCGLRGLNTVLAHARRKLGKSEIQSIESVEIISLEKNTPVYNIKIDDGYAPEFFANGVLVHNCSVSRMPAIVLTGISPSGLNASSDGEIRIFYDWIAAQQEAFWREPLEVILKTVQLSLFGEIDPDIGVAFVPLFQMTPKEESEIRLSDSQADCAYVAAGIVDPSEVRDRLAKDPNSGYQGMDTDAVIVPPEPAGETDPAEASGGGEKFVSEAQHRAMEAAASGKSTLGIPKSVGNEFVAKDADFKEGDHPRAENGTFGSGGGGATKPKHSPEQMAKWAEEKRHREQSQIAASSKERAETAERSKRAAESVTVSAMAQSFTESEIADIQNYYKSGDRHGAQAEGRNATISAIEREAKKNGLEIEHVSESQGGKSKSLYIKSGNELVRVSDHELPTTPERMTNREQGRNGRWDREVIVTDWNTTSLADYIAEIKGHASAT